MSPTRFSRTGTTVVAGVLGLVLTTAVHAAAAVPTGFTGTWGDGAITSSQGLTARYGG